MTPSQAAGHHPGAADSSLVISEYLARTRFEDLPADLVRQAKASILDTLACSLLGSGNAELQPIRDYVMRSGGAGPCTLLGTGMGRAGAEGAVLHNCAGVHQFDFDDTFDLAPCHPGSASVLPSLALAEMAGPVSGKEWITAVALANELTCRLSLSIRGKVHDYPWFRAPIVGIFGATAAASRILGCDAGQHLQALGLTLPMVGGTFASLEHPGSDVRSVRDGIAYRNGVVAAQLARHGLRGDQQVFDGPFGFFHAFFHGEYAPQALTQDLGRVHHAARVSLKPWPSIRHVHTALTAVHDILHQHALAEGDIARVLLRVGATTRQRCGPVARGGLPGTRMDLLGNLPFAVANMISHGDMPLDVYRDNARADKVIDVLERKVAWEFDDGATGTRTFERSHVEITTVAGAVHVAECADALGHPDNPMSTQQRHEKFARCARSAFHPIDDARIGRAIARIEELENVPDISDIARLLA